MTNPYAAWHRTGRADAPALLLLHGFTGSPGALIPLAQSLHTADARAGTGTTMSVPLLPGHGRSWQELGRTRWEDWLEAATAEYDGLAARHPSVVVCGLSMGGALACALGAVRDPAELVLVNPGLRIDSPLAPLLPVLSRVLPSIPAIGGDICRPDADEYANDRTPLAALASFHRALPALLSSLWSIDCPVTACISGTDSVVSPRSHRLLRTHLTAPLRTVVLRRSAHVATVDYDAPVIAAELHRALAEARAPRSAAEAL